MWGRGVAGDEGTRWNKSPLHDNAQSIRSVTPLLLILLSDALSSSPFPHLLYLSSPLLISLIFLSSPYSRLLHTLFRFSLTSLFPPFLSFLIVSPPLFLFSFTFLSSLLSSSYHEPSSHLLFALLFSSLFSFPLLYIPLFPFLIFSLSTLAIFPPLLSSSLLSSFSCNNRRRWLKHLCHQCRLMF